MENATERTTIVPGLRRLRRLLIALVATAGVAAVSHVYQGGYCAMAADASVGIKTTVDGGTRQSPVERGRYLVTIAGCNDCHTPFKMTDRGPEPDMDRMLSGHPEQMKLPPAPKAQGPWVWSGAATNTAFAGPWGVTYAANLTPDKNTGLGIWDERMFIKTLRTGRHWGVARPILPPMPWQNYRQATDEDLKAIFAFLQSLPPVSNEVPEPVPPPGA